MAAVAVAGGFERLTPRGARLVLAATAAVALFFVAVTLSPLASGFADAPDRGASDVQLYQAEVARIQSGEGYYDAAAAELAARGYPTRSVFNWRTPLPMWLLGKLPDAEFGRVLLSLLALAGIVVASHLVARDRGLRRGMLCGVWLIGALLPCFLDKLYVMHELWAGALILLSVLAYGANRPAWGAATGFAALAIRELAAPYCALCFAMAIAERRRTNPSQNRLEEGDSPQFCCADSTKMGTVPGGFVRGSKEIWFWLFAAAFYGLFYTLHMLQVLPRILPGARAHSDGWLCLGGAAFVISIAQMNAFLLLLPQWITAIFLAAALLGFAGWNSNWGKRAGLAASLYLALFAVVGQPFNQYWGSLVAPLLCLGIAQAPDAITTLWRGAIATTAAKETAAAVPAS